MPTVPDLLLPQEDQSNVDPAPSAPSLLSEAVADTKARSRTEFVSTMEAVAPINPDMYAKATKLERSSGIPASILKDHTEQLDKINQGTMWANIFDNNDRTAQALKDGNLAAISQDDLENLTRIEQAGKVATFEEQSTGEKLLNSFKSSLAQSDQSGKLQFTDRLERQRKQFDQIDAEIARAAEVGEQPYATGSMPIGFGQDYLNSTPEDRIAMRDRLLGRQEKNVEQIAAAQETLDAIPQETGALRAQELQTKREIGIPLGGMDREIIESDGESSLSATATALMENPGYAARTSAGAVVSSAPMLLAGAIGGIPAAAAAELSTEYDAKLSDVLNEAGVDMKNPKAILDALQDDELMTDARARAARKAAGTTAVDILSMGLAGKLLVPKAIGGKTLTATQQELVNLGVQFPVQGLTEGLSEAAGQYAADQKVDAGEVLLEAVAGAGMSSADVAVFGIGPRVVDSISEGLKKSRASRQSSAALGEMVDAANNSKTKARDVQSFRELADQQLEGTAVEAVWIPAEELQKLNQSGTDVAAILQNIPGMTEQFAEAEARGGSVTMKTADYLAYFSEHHEQLAKSVRTQVDGMSTEDTIVWQKEQEDQIQAVADGLNREPDEKDQAFIGMMSELQQAGYRRADAEQYATTHLAAMSTLAERTGKPLSELMQRFPLDIRNQAPERLQRIAVDDMRLAIQRVRAGDIPQSRDMLGKSLSEYLRDAGGLNDAGGELAALDADVGKVGRNRLVRKDGQSLDEAAMAAWERGYFPGVAREDVGPQLIVDAVRDDMNDKPRFSAEQENATLRDQAVNLQQLADYLQQLDVNLDELTDDQVIGLLRNQNAEGSQQLNQSGTELDRALDMTEDEYIAAINPSGKTTDEDDIVIVERGDLSLPEDATQTDTIRAKNGDEVTLYTDPAGVIYAVEGGEVVGQIEEQDGETLNIVVQQSQGQGIGTALAAALIREKPFAVAGSLSPAGERARRSAFRALKAERETRLNQAESRQDFVARLENENPGLRLDLLGNGSTITLSRIELPKAGRNQGAGTQVMQQITDWADANGKTVALSASTDFGSSKGRLTEFYKRFGFVENKGKNRDFEISEGMYRQPRLNQGGDQDNARGFISFNEGQGVGAGRKFQITVNAKRDLSTLLHEFGHFYLEVLNDLAQDADAPVQITDDIAAVRKWVGAEEGKPLTVDQHEQFARGFEKYLAEGKAPNPELAGAFARFKRWLIAIYKDLSRLDVELSPAIRGVFDRLIATDEQIAAAEQVIGAVQMFETAKKAGMTDAEFADYQKQTQAAADEARTSVEQDVIREEERRHSKWWREESERVREEVNEELDTLPQYAAMKALRGGVMPDGSPTLMKLQTGEILERYGLPVLRKLSFMHSKNGGVPMDMAASVLGFDSGDAMVKAILGAVPRNQMLKQETEQRMQERHGGKASGEAAERAMDAVHNEKRAAVLIKELAALAKMGSRKTITSQQIMRTAAERIMQQRKVRDIQPHEYQRSEAKAGREAFALAAKGDLEGAYRAKQEQLLNFYLWREALKARTAVDGIVERMAKNNTRSRREKLGKAGHDYLNQIDKIMEQYEFRSISLIEVDKNKSFASWYAEQVEAGNDPYVPEFILNTTRKVNYKDLSLEQLGELDEFAANINYFASMQGKLSANLRIADLKEAQALLSASAFDNMDKLPTAHLVANARSLPEVAMDWLKRGNSSLLKMEQVIEWLDGGDPNGAWSSIFFQPLAEAQHRRDSMNKEVTDRVVKLTKEWMDQRGSTTGEIFKVNGLPQPMTTNGMLAVALNMGNESNATKLLNGYGWDRSVADEILRHMTQADWTFVAKMWETVESLWPHIEALEKQVNGIAPPKVEGLTINTPWGDVKGGYWPLVYDPLSQKYADVQKTMGNLAPLSESGTVRATPSRGHTKARVDSFAAPILLDVSVIGQHLNQVVHDLTHRVALNDAHRLIKGEVREAMNQTIGPQMAAQFVNILDGVASDQATGSSASIGAFSQVMTALRTNQAVAWMGYSVTTVFNQLGGYPQALDYFAQKGGRKYLYRALLKFWGSPIENSRMIRSMSGEMENRAVNLDASIREAQRQVVRMKDGRFVQDAFKGMLNGRDVMVKYAFVPVQVMQSVVDGVVWMGAYEMGGGTLNHEQAVEAADRAVRMTQTAGGAKDMAAIQQNLLAKMFMPVYGYASLLWNRNVDIARSGVQGVKARSATQVLVAFERFVYLNLLPAILSGAIKGAIPDDDDDEETLAGWLGIQALLGIAAGVPLAGPVAQGFFGDFGYSGASTIGQGFDSLIRSRDAKEEKTITTNAISAIGAFTGIPASQINRSVSTGFMLENGEMNDSAWSITKGLLVGPPKKKD